MCSYVYLHDFYNHVIKSTVTSGLLWDKVVRYALDSNNWNYSILGMDLFKTVVHPQVTYYYSSPTDGRGPPGPVPPVLYRGGWSQEADIRHRKLYQATFVEAGP